MTILKVFYWGHTGVKHIMNVFLKYHNLVSENNIYLTLKIKIVNKFYFKSFKILIISKLHSYHQVQNISKFVERYRCCRRRERQQSNNLKGYRLTQLQDNVERLNANISNSGLEISK